MLTKEQSEWLDKNDLKTIRTLMRQKVIKKEMTYKEYRMALLYKADKIRYIEQFLKKDK